MEAEQLAREYQKVRGFAAEIGFQWVLDELDEAIEEGVTETKRLRSVKRNGRDDFEEVASTAPGRKRAEEFLVRRPLTLEEQVEALLGALRRALVDVERVSQQSIEQLQPLASANRSLLGLDDEPTPRPTERATTPVISEIDWVPDQGSRDVVGISTEGLRHRTRGGTTDLLSNVLHRLSQELLS
ncbi:hypothetical protein [Motilibacter deserti]|uniref:Uncharacterized protein n=1 Tax=Motilibacter deserti TaxID=2714956 RepID=A0ABX0GY92_9ACTN|nr:hypothetical protein [Motilibacter deserti]NHC15957.1 hypothetical protein [Motilibacter deserti]